MKLMTLGLLATLSLSVSANEQIFTLEESTINDIVSRSERLIQDIDKIRNDNSWLSERRHEELSRKEEKIDVIHIKKYACIAVTRQLGQLDMIGNIIGSYSERQSMVSEALLAHSIDICS